jgi:hypothetical protein
LLGDADTKRLANPYHVLRLCQIAAETGKGDPKAFADAIADESLKAWAQAEAVRLTAAATPGEKADEGLVVVPDDVKAQKAGHAWGRLWVARHNAAVSRSRKAEKKAVDAWPPTVRPFGLAGIVLGLQDK